LSSSVNVKLRYEMCLGNWGNAKRNIFKKNKCLKGSISNVTFGSHHHHCGFGKRC
jgi:hypothetical protein